MHCAQNQTKMAASKEDVQQISSACAIAKQALEAIGILQNKDIRNVAALAATNVFSLWNTNREEIDQFISEANRHHPTIKFTAEISEKEINFPDTTVFKGERFVV